MSPLPALFLSHGPPDLLLRDCPARRALDGLGRSLARPRAIVVVSAHHIASRVAVTASVAPPTVHDFRGFDPILRDMRYPAPGAPALAERIVQTVAAGGIGARLDGRRGLDHGAWVPLMRMFPRADIPVVQVSLMRGADPMRHYRLGRALGALVDQGILLIGSGGLTHNLDAMAPRDEPPEWVRVFADWVERCIRTEDLQTLLSYRSMAPHAVRNHPTEEHLLPLFAALGAAGPRWHGRRIHESVLCSVLAMDGYAFSRRP